MHLLCLVFLLIFVLPAWGAEKGTVTGLNQTLPEVETAHSLGAKWHRIFVNWEYIEHADNQYASAWLDNLRQRVAALDAKGIKSLVVVSFSPAWARSGGVPQTPPVNSEKYGEFMGYMANQFPTVEAWEIWNEPDGNEFWENGPQPVKYTEMLKSAYAHIKANNPQALVITGGMVAHNYDFLKAIYDHGGAGFFDGVGVHTDTACLIVGPDYYYREPDGKIGRYVFTGYRELHHLMEQNGEGHKGIWMTEIGWNTGSTQTNSCINGAKAGTKPAGVTEIQQAEFLRQAFETINYDPYVKVAFWFSIQDIGTTGDYAHHLGLYRPDGSEKPAVNVFKSLESVSARFRGALLDKTPPTIHVQRPTNNFLFTERLKIQATAQDDSPVKIRLLVDGQRFGGTYNNGAVSLDPWWGSRSLSYGAHTLTIQAYDEAQNVAETHIHIYRTDGGQLPPIETRPELQSSLQGQILTVTGRITHAPTNQSLTGYVNLYVEKLIRGRKRTRWIKRFKHAVHALQPWNVSTRLTKGRWRIRVVYRGKAPFKQSTRTIPLIVR